MKKILLLGVILISLFACESDEAKIIGNTSVGDGDILSGITVKLYDMDTELVSSTTTNSDGKFVFSNLKAGNYYLGATVTHDGNTYDTGVTPKLIYVSDEISKEVSLNLTLRED